MSEDTNVEKKSEKKTDDGLAAKVRHLEEKVQRMSDNWKKFAQTHLGASANDGKLGMAKVGFVLVLAVAMFAGLVMARDLVNWSGSESSTLGNAKIATDDAGTATLTVDKVTANNIAFSGTYTGLTGTILISNITANGELNFTGPMLASNAANKVYSYTNVCTDLTAKGTVTLPAASIASASMAAGTYANASLYSNAANKFAGATGVFDIAVVNTTVTLPAGGVANAALAGKTALYTTVTPTIVTNANGGTNVVTFSVFDLAGTAATTPTAIRFWISDDAQGTPAAVAGDVAISGGVELQEVVNKADYWVMCTNLLGTVVATITDTPGGTNYIHVMAPCGKITKVPSAFNIVP